MRRLMYRSWKYALLYHLILNKESNVIDRTDVAWAMRATRQHIIDLLRILSHYNYSHLAKLIEKTEILMNKKRALGKSFGAREVVSGIRGVSSIPQAKQILELLAGRNIDKTATLTPEKKLNQKVD